jgi:hypothetical protein
MTGYPARSWSHPSRPNSGQPTAVKSSTLTQVETLMRSRSPSSDTESVFQVPCSSMASNMATLNFLKLSNGSPSQPASSSIR